MGKIVSEVPPTKSQGAELPPQSLKHPPPTELITGGGRLPKFKSKPYIIGLICLIFLSGVALVAVLNSPAKDTGHPLTPAKKKPSSATTPSLLNGVLVDPKIADRHPVAVMIENSQDARPQTGLTDADIVYEAVTEGGITRYMAIYSQKYPTNAGPVRSARSYFIDWLADYDAFYAHAGGSPTALSRIREYGLKDYPHSGEAYTRRAQAGLASEHTLYVNVEKIFQLGTSKKGWPSTRQTKAWLFKAPAHTATALANSVAGKFSSASFDVLWR
ncbi:MAG: DUF3048 domain-containing protein, partial [Patescibacteria group bacterium]